jgi:hypothetical protein
MPSALDRLRQTLIALTQRGARTETVKTIRRSLAVLARTARLSQSERAAELDGIAETAAFHNAETGAWAQPTPDTIAKIALGRKIDQGFDACDLGIWLAVAMRAGGIETIPAKRILSLTEDEMSALTAFSRDDLRHMAGFVAHSAEHNARFADGVIETLERSLATTRDPTQPDHAIDPAELVERCSAAMDDVPEGWMVRFARCGSENLKALASCGAAGWEVPEVRFSNDLEIGPGWFRRGNRRCVDVADARIVRAAAESPVGPKIFYARPWVKPARLTEADDPTRAASPLKGNGFWPVELRAFVKQGRVVGVSHYYPQADLPLTPRNARLMLDARAKAQKIADLCAALKLYPRLMDVEFARRIPAEKAPPGFHDNLAQFGREDVAFTCDFLETDRMPDGKPCEPHLVFLEAGPAVTPMGGGHPCAFAGCGGPPKFGAMLATEGAAFSLMDHVNIFEPSTWVEGDRTGHILTWPQVEALAASNETEKSE